MANITKYDVDVIANAYLRSRVNGNINPYHNGWYPGYVNTGYLTSYSGDPTEAHPSWNGQLSATIYGSQVRSAVVSLGNYYSRVVRGRYGLLGNTASCFTAYGYFAIGDNYPGMANHSATTRSQVSQLGTPGGSIGYNQVAYMYDYAWGIINSRKEAIEPDLTVCHSSYVAPPHSSRGRR